jgi:hypothetical protein
MRRFSHRRNAVYTDMTRHAPVYLQYTIERGSGQQGRWNENDVSLVLCPTWLMCGKFANTTRQVLSATYDSIAA